MVHNLRDIGQLMLFMQNIVKLDPLIKPCIIPWSHFIFWFMMGKSSWVPSHTQGFILIVADNVMYQGYCKNYFAPTVDEE